MQIRSRILVAVLFLVPSCSAQCSLYTTCTSCMDSTSCSWCDKLVEGGSGCVPYSSQLCTEGFNAISTAGCACAESSGTSCDACRDQGGYSCSWCNDDGTCRPTSTGCSNLDLLCYDVGGTVNTIVTWVIVIIVVVVVCPVVITIGIIGIVMCVACSSSKKDKSKGDTGVSQEAQELQYMAPPVYMPQPAYNSQNGYSPQPAYTGYTAQPGYSSQPGYSAQSGYSTMTADAQTATPYGQVIMAPIGVLPQTGSKPISAVFGQTKVIEAEELKIMQLIGEGAFGVVHKGEYRAKDVAVKMLKGVHLTEEEMMEFIKEIELIKSIPYHSNIVPLFGICENPLCIVTEFMHGGSVLDVIKLGLLPIERVIAITKDTASALIHLHAEKVVHRDLACRNLLLHKSGEVKISDFGMSRSFDGINDVTQSDMGPLRWMAPECLQKKQYSPASDIWALGCVVIELLTGKPPFYGTTATDAAAGVAFRGLTPPIPERCPPQLADILMSCFQSDPANRPTASMVAQKLNAIVHQQE